MPYKPELIEELKILTKYDLNSTQVGIKVHQHDADSNVITAVERLHDKGLVTQSDGGYLTHLGREAAEHAQAVMAILNS